MISTPSPRTEREPVASRRKFGWGWLAGAVLCLVLLVGLVLRDLRVRRVNAPARVAKQSANRSDATLFPQVDADEAAEPSITDPLTIKTTPTPADLATVSTMPKALVFQKTRIVANSPTAGVANLVSIRGIQPEFVKSPVYVLTQGPAKAFTPRTWLRVVVTFASSAARSRELTLRYRIFLGDEMFGGAMKYADIFGAGEHQFAAFVIPAAVEPLIQRPGFDASKSVAIEVTALLGETEVARSEFGRLPVVPPRESSGWLRRVEDTPFAPLEIDLYELTTPPTR